MPITIKPCLECTTQNSGDAVTCVACGGGSWPDAVALVPEAPPAPPAPSPKAESVPAPPPSDAFAHSSGASPSYPVVAEAFAEQLESAPATPIEHPELAETAEQPAVEEGVIAVIGPGESASGVAIGDGTGQPLPEVPPEAYAADSKPLDPIQAPEAVSEPPAVGAVETDPNEPPNFDGDEPDVTSQLAAPAVETTPSSIPKPAISASKKKAAR